MTDVSTSYESAAPHMDFVPRDRIHECIATANCPEMEIAARRSAWHDLNHFYREQYRAHREVEETSLRSVWQLANPDRRSFWQRLIGQKAPSYVRPNMPITFPEFNPSVEQVKNMTRLCELIVEEGDVGGKGDMLEVAELYRELGKFADAKHAIASIPHEYNPVARKLIAELIANNEASPVRFRY